MERTYVRVMIRFKFSVLGRSKLPFSLLAGCLTLIAASSEAQVTLNVTNYGARGDAVYFWANTTSNSAVITTTNPFSNSDIGKVIELFGAGPPGTSTNHQDLLAIITNVVKTTNLYISRVAGITTNGCLGVYGHNNATNFQNCINAAPSNSIIYIPNGTYLIIGASNFVDFSMASPWVGFPSLVIQKGAITFLGQSWSGTTLLGCGAWQNKGSYALRGYMFKFIGPVTNNGPLIFDRMTIDGGVQAGCTRNGNFPASAATGDGWDCTHRAFQDFTSLPFFNTRIFRNLHVKRWRGEQFYNQMSWDTPLSTPAIVITNCTFSDGDATALNLSAGNIVDHCVFSNLNEVCEFYEGYATHRSVFQNCLVTNMFGALMAFNGALSNSVNPTYTIQSNLFYMPTAGGNGIQTTPAQNIIISQNTFIGNGGGTAIAIGIAGYQGSAPNSNILISCNTFTNVYFPIQVEGTGNNAVYNVQVISNTSSGGNSFAYGSGWCTNVTFTGNVVSGFWYGLNSSLLTGQWYLDDVSNRFPAYGQTDNAGKTNTISYIFGMRQQISTSRTNSIWVIDDTHPAQIPPGAVLQITHAGSCPAPLYFSAAMSGTPTVLTTGQTVTCLWTNGLWANLPQPVVGFRVVETRP
jgi:hypothetical protein